MDDVRSNALRRRGAIETQIASLKTELAEIDTFLALHAEFSRTKSVLIDAEGEQVVFRLPDATAPAPDRKRGRPADFADIMERILEEVGRPLGRPEMVEELERRNIVIPSDDKPRYLGTILWRHRDTFLNLPGNGYWIKRLPYEPAEYNPTTDPEGEAVLDAEINTIEAPDLPDTLSQELLLTYARAFKEVRDAKNRGAKRAEYISHLALKIKIEQKFPQVIGKMS